MLHSHNLPVGTFTRYVGNRIHILFHLAGILILHYDKVKEFIQMQCTAAELLRSRILKDLSNDKIAAQIWALGVLGKIFSGPWMTKFYSAQMSNLEMRPLVQKCDSLLETWIEMPQTLLEPTTNVFGEPLSPDKDDVLAALYSFTGDADIQIEALSASLVSCQTVLRKQLADFLKKEEPSLAIKESVSSAPTHNMASERALGSLDKMMRRAPVATGGFLNGKVKSKINKMTKWLEEKSAEEQERIIAFVISEAKEERVRRCLGERKVGDEISQRRVEVASERQKKKKNGALKMMKKALKEKCLSALSDISDSLKERIRRYLQDANSVVGVLFIHTVDGSEFYGRVIDVDANSVVGVLFIHTVDGSEFYGRVIDVDSNTSDMNVGYWGLQESETSSVDYVLSVPTFFADAALGTVLFL